MVDVLVIGGGNAALCAALMAREAGASVLLLEASPKEWRGGNSIHTRNLRCMHDEPQDVLTEAYPEEEYWQDLLKVTGGITDEMVECFVGYLAGHHRPLHEVLASRDHDLTSTYENEFKGMARMPISLEALVASRDRLRQELDARLTANHRAFMLGLVAGEPDWNLMRCGHLRELPAIRWKLQNLAKLRRTSPQKYALQSAELRALFGA